MNKVIVFITALALVIMLLLTAASQAIFADMGYYRSEFEKYSVTDNIDMKMDDIMYVMDELMDYLHGDRENLDNIVTDVNGERKDFFSEREKSHMADCKEIFDKAFLIRKICAVIFAVITAVLIALKKFDIKELFKAAGAVAIVISAVAGVIGLAASNDFNRCFILFHKLFFDNDLWLLDPDKDLIINILVEPFFGDMAARIAVYCTVVLIVLIITVVGINISDKKRRNYDNSVKNTENNR